MSEMKRLAELRMNLYNVLTKTQPDSPASFDLEGAMYIVEEAFDTLRHLTGNTDYRPPDIKNPKRIIDNP